MKYGEFEFDPTRLGRGIVYSCGVGEDIDFDMQLVELGCTVWCIDPTPRAVKYLSKHKHPNLIPLNVAISSTDGMAEFFTPTDPKHVSCSLIQSDITQGGSIQVQTLRLDSIASKLGHSHIDVLKLDIEGEEYMVMDDILQSNVKVTQLIVETHNFLGLLTADLISSILDAGYRQMNCPQNFDNHTSKFLFIKG